MSAYTNQSHSHKLKATSIGLPNPARILTLAIILIAYALRSFHLDFQSLAGDEGISIIRSAQTLPAMLKNMPVEHVPGYFVLLHFWMQVAGQTDFAIRTLSLMPGVFVVAFIVRMGADFGSWRAGVIAAALLATSAFQVWYAQEARTYSWLLLAGALSTWFLWLLLTRKTNFIVWIGYVLSTALAVYLHYFGFLVPIVHTLMSVLWLATRRNTRAFLNWMAAGFAVVVLFLPWTGRAIQLFGFEGWREPVDPNKIPWQLLLAYTAGETMPDVWSRWIPLLYLALILFGVAVWYRLRADAGFFLSVIALSAVILTWLLVIRQQDFHVRYTIFVSAPLILLAAGGVSGLDANWRRSGQADSLPRPSTGRSVLSAIPWLVLALLIAANALALNRLYHDETVHRPDFRSAARHIMNNLEPGDVILVDGPNPELVFEHYYDGAAPVYDLRQLAGQPDEAIYARLQEIMNGAGRAWELLYFKTPGPVQVWLATRGWAAAPTFHNNIRVQLVGLDVRALTTRSIDTFFGDALELRSSAYDPGPHHPGDLVRISTNWFTHTQAPEYKFSQRLFDANSVEIAAYDYVPQNWFAPTHVWFVDAPATDQYGLLLPADLAAGPYRVTLRLYDPYTGEPVQTASGVDVPIADIVVEERPSVSP